MNIEMRYLTFAIAKGRLAKKTLELFEEIGIQSNMEQKSRKLILTNEDLKLKFFLAKASDVPTYVEYGVADIGFVGKDTIQEERKNLYEVLDLGFGKCKMVVAGLKERQDSYNKNNFTRVATKYPNIAKDFFYNDKNKKVDIIKLNGSIELAPLVGLSDVIVDIVETGSTLKENGLIVFEEICDISARMVVNRVSLKMENDRISSIIDKLNNKL